MTYIYLDWNVFNKIEKKESLDDQNKSLFSKIENLILEGKIVAPYSNAHINDLVRGYEKDGSYIPSHLDTLRRLTKNLAIVQYWGHKGITWHHREIDEFFNSSLEDLKTSANSFSELMDWDETGLMKIQLDILRSQKLPDQFREVYKVDPIFSLMFPKSKTEMNLLALSEDLFNFSNNAKKDYLLYKSLRTYITKARVKFKQQPNMFTEIDKTMSSTPRHLSFDESWERYIPKNKTSENPACQRITDTYFKIDLRGFKSDEKFPNLIDDSLHVFYGAHCDYFVTLDDKCHYKAKETYKELSIKSKAVKPYEFVEAIGI